MSQDDRIRDDTMPVIGMPRRTRPVAHHRADILCPGIAYHGRSPAPDFGGPEIRTPCLFTNTPVKRVRTRPKHCGGWTTRISLWHANTAATRRRTGPTVFFPPLPAKRAAARTSPCHRPGHAAAAVTLPDHAVCDLTGESGFL